jgi:hypothetical protein
VHLPECFGGPSLGLVDLLSGAEYEWHPGGNYVRLPPGGAHILAVR